MDYVMPLCTSCWLYLVMAGCPPHSDTCICHFFLFQFSLLFIKARRLWATAMCLLGSVGSGPACPHMSRPWAGSQQKTIGKNKSSGCYLTPSLIAMEAWPTPLSSKIKNSHTAAQNVCEWEASQCSLHTLTHCNRDFYAYSLCWAKINFMW
jgi:hypothetical protein